MPHINFTGIDGCGKGTQIDLLKEVFINKQIPFYISKAYGQLEKEQLAAFVEMASENNTIMFLFQALHVEQRAKAKNAQEKGMVIISDRWDESYYAYHSHHPPLSEDPYMLVELNEIAFQGMKPDITFFLDIDVEVGMMRCVARGADFFDRKGIEHHTQTRDFFVEEAKKNQTWITINGEKRPDHIHKEILEILRQRMIIT